MKRLVSFLLVLVPCLFALSCEPENNGGSETADPAVLGVVVSDAKDVFEVPEHQSVTLSLTVSANPTSAEAYTITLGVNTGLVEAYNAKNGTSYQMLPSEAFTLAATPLVLPKYAATSAACELRLKGEGCDPALTYLLPISIDAVKGGTNFQAPDEKAAYIVFKMLEAEGEGKGTQASPYIIKDLDGFLAIGSMLQDDATTYFKLKEDIDFSGVTFNGENPWVPINYTADEDGQSAARARKIDLNGNGHKISGFKADGPLFAILCGSVKDLTLDGFDIDSDMPDAATLIGVAGSGNAPEDLVLKNIKVTNSKVMNQNDRAGGLVARMRNGLVEDCSADCSVEAKTRAGGLIGYVDAGTFNNCSASGDIKTVTYYGGGLIGWAGSVTVSGCHASGNIVSEGGNYVRGGGLIGQIENNSTIEKCYATGNVSGQGHMGGGLIGVISCGKVNDVYEDINVSISECYATGSVDLPHGESNNWAHAGGLLGTISTSLGSTVSIANCYSTGAFFARRYSGGFVGSIYDKARACKQLTITNSYTTSDITGIVLSDRCGLVLGLNDGANATTPTVISCTGFVAWDTSDRGFSYNECVSVEGNYYGTEGTVTQQAQALGWSTDIWDFSGSEPKLKNVK